MPNEIRWHCRFETFSRVYSLLLKALEGDIKTMSFLELAGVIKHFELTFELGWKLLKDRLEHDGVSLATGSPRAVLLAACQSRLIEDDKTWLDMMGTRNKTTHMYDADLVADVAEDIQSRYLPVLADLYAKSIEQMPVVSVLDVPVDGSETRGVDKRMRSL